MTVGVEGVRALQEAEHRVVELRALLVGPLAGQLVEHRLVPEVGGTR